MAKFSKHLLKCENLLKTKHLGHKFQCKDCKKSFPVRSSFRFHVQSVHQGIRFPCDECGQKFRHRRDLKNHHRAVHLGILQNCDHCEMKFKTIGGLKYHSKFICIKNSRSSNIEETLVKSNINHI